MNLKKFQQEAVDSLATYLDRARVLDDPEKAFIEAMRQDDPSSQVPPYRNIPGLPGVPNVCLRLPTGGGKTILAAYSIAIAARTYLERDFPVVLWFVPTTTIRTQTAEALKKPYHPYREAIEKAYSGRVSVFDISEIWQIRPQDLTDRVSIIVCTIQALRTSNTEGRRAYAHSEIFEPHFSHIPPNTPGLEKNDKGDLNFSFVNLMAFHRPLVIVDEAHKAGTSLSFDMLAALRPSCIVEFTATPSTDSKTGSNVLFRASAAQVKDAEMIKLPIILTEHPDWRSAVHDAIETRARLAESAKADEYYIRPITLFQAQDKGQEVTVEVLKQYLIENENIDASRIAIATGSQRELDSLNLFEPTCPIEFIITVEALKEGWDCSFAYVLCSVANIGSATDIEQLLGRVLRMPYATSRKIDALNRAYTHVSSQRFGDGARALADTLIEKMGFQPDEAAGMVERRQASLPGFGTNADIFDGRPVLQETLAMRPNLQGLEPEVASRVQVEEGKDGSFTLIIEGDITDDLEERLVAAAGKEGAASIKAAVHRHRVVQKNHQSPAERGEKFPVPRLYIRVQGELEFVEEALILDLCGWTLNSFKAKLSAQEFSIRDTAERWEVDLRGEKITYKHLDQDAQLEIGALKIDWTALELSRWLDRETLQMDVKPNDITQPVRLEFCRKVIESLIEHRGIPLADLLRFKFQLAKAVHQKIVGYRRLAYADSYQTYLFAPQAEVETNFIDGFSFEKAPYPAAWFYSGGYQFKNHFFGGIGELKSSGEEFDCAQVIDLIPEVKYWIRNLASRPASSFWLATAKDRFYPDFVALLNDGRTLVIEYKGEHLIDSADTKKKTNVGELWASKSNGMGLFLMAEKVNANGQSVREQILSVIGA